MMGSGRPKLCCREPKVGHGPPVEKLLFEMIMLSRNFCFIGSAPEFFAPSKKLEE